jgi:hypothetical protein
LIVKVLYKVLILWTSSGKPIGHEGAHVFQIRKTREVQERGEENHTEEVTPNVPGLVVHLEERAQDFPNGLFIADTITSSDELVID